jgi:4-amino-4-deoxy-L-arabinose transferase-like glycosyltransferase
MEAEDQVGKWGTQRLAWPVIAAAAVRLTLLAIVLARSGASALSRPDTNSYLDPGRNLLLHGRFVEAGLPELERTPGYPLFLALTSMAGPVAAALAQVALSVLSVVLVWRLARAVFRDGRIALAAAWIFAFEPLSVTFSILLLSETLFLALFLLSLERLAEFLRERRLSVLAAAGVCLAAATFVRPVTYYLLFALAAGFSAVFARVPSLRWKAPAVLLLSVLPWLAAWQIRNRMETGFGGFSSIQREDLYFLIAAEVKGRVEHRPLTEVQHELGYNDEQLFLARHPAAAKWNQAQRLEFMQSEASRVLRAHPSVFLRTHFAGTMRVALNPGAAVLISLLNTPVDDETFLRERDQGPLRAELWMARRHPWQMAVMAVLEGLLLALYGLAVRGAVRGGAPGACLWLLVGVSLYFLAISGGAIAAARMRLPVMPVVCIMAAAGVARRKAMA